MPRRRRTTGASTGCPSSTRCYDVLQVFETDGPGQDERLHLPGLQPARRLPQQGQARRGAGQAQVPGHHRSAGHRDLRVLARTSASTTTSIRRRSRPRCSACPPPASPRRTARSSTPAAGCNGTGRAPSRRARPRPTPRSWPASSSSCASCTRRRAARSPIRS